MQRMSLLGTSCHTSAHRHQQYWPDTAWAAACSEHHFCTISFCQRACLLLQLRVFWELTKDSISHCSSAIKNLLCSPRGVYGSALTLLFTVRDVHVCAAASALDLGCLLRGSGLFYYVAVGWSSCLCCSFVGSMHPWGVVVISCPEFFTSPVRSAGIWRWLSWSGLDTCI